MIAGVRATTAPVQASATFLAYARDLFATTPTSRSVAAGLDATPLVSERDKH